MDDLIDKLVKLSVFAPAAVDGGDEISLLALELQCYLEEFTSDEISRLNEILK